MNENKSASGGTSQPRAKQFFVLFLAAGFVIALDQWTKWLVRRDIPLGESWLPRWLDWLSPYARILHIQNSGASFGMLQNGNTIFIILSLVVIAGILYYIYTLQSTDLWMWLAAGLYMGGAVGNLIDRLIAGQVTDFISVGTFYIFNVADASINVSVAMLIIIFWLRDRRSSKSVEATSEKENHE